MDHEDEATLIEPAAAPHVKVRHLSRQRGVIDGCPGAWPILLDYMTEYIADNAVHQSPSYSPKLEDDDDFKPDVQATAPPKADLISSSDFRVCLYRSYRL